MKTLNASPIGVGSTPALALADYAGCTRDTRYTVLEPDEMSVDHQPKRDTSLQGVATPLIVHHGTGTSIERFDFEFTNRGHDSLGSGFYFTTDFQQAEEYALRRIAPEFKKPGGEDKPNVITAELVIRSPISRSTSDKELTRMVVIKILEKSPCLKAALENFGDLENEGFDKVLEIAANSYTAKPGGEGELLRVLFALANDFFPNHVQAFNQAIHNVLGYDGYVENFSNGITHYVAFFPEQIHIMKSTAVHTETVQIADEVDQDPESPLG